MNRATPDQDTPNSIKLAINQSAESVAVWAIGILGALMFVFIIGANITEVVAVIIPKIPEPAVVTAPLPRTQSHHSQVTTRWSKRIVLYVRGADRQRLVQTLTNDVARHGGRTIKNDPKQATWTFAVPHTYFPRIRKLITSSGVKPPHTTYREWANEVHQDPYDPSIAGPANVVVTLQLAVPFLNNPATKLLIKWTLIASLIAFLTIPTAFLTEWFTDDA